MTKILPALLIALCLLASCKKEKQNPTSSPDNGQVQSAPLINNLSAAFVTAGMSLTLNGTGLPTNAADLKVRFNGVDAAIEYISTNVIAVKVPVTTSGNIQLVTGTKTVTGPAFVYINTPVIKTASPEEVTTGTIVTLTGSDLLFAGSAAKVTVNGVSATIKSATSAEITFEVPRTSTGKVVVTVAPNITGAGPELTYTKPELLTPYQSGDVILESQGDVDAFAALNKGKALQISGDLTIKGTSITSVAGLSIISTVSGTIDIGFCPALQEAPFLNTLTAAGGFDLNNSGLTTLRFDRLNAFAGKFWLRSLNNLHSVSFSNFNTVTGLYLYSCPQLTDVSFLSNLRTVGAIYLYHVGGPELHLDQVSSTARIEVSSCSFNNVSFRSLTAVAEYLSISEASELTKANFNALQTLGDKLELVSTGLADLSGFAGLKTAGALSLRGNVELTTLRGLEGLTKFTAIAVSSGTSALIPTRINGVFISGNPKLTTLAGLQGIQSVPVILITNNAALNDLCPLSERINAMKAWPSYTYTYKPCCNTMISTQTASVKAVNLTGNGRYTSLDDALLSISNCK